MLLIKEAKPLYVHDDDLEVSLKGNVFAIDATTINMSLSAFAGLLLEAPKVVSSFIHNLI